MGLIRQRSESSPDRSAAEIALTVTQIPTSGKMTPNTTPTTIILSPDASAMM